MQTSYSIDQAAGVVGGIADSAIVQDIESFKNPGGEVKFGHVVTRGAASEEIVHPDAAIEITDKKLVRGIVVAAHEMESQSGSAAPGYKAKSVVPVMRKGRIWVKAEDVITEGTSTVNVRFLGGAGGTQLGAIRGAAVVGETAELPNAKFKSSTSANGELAILEIDL